MFEFYFPHLMESASNGSWWPSLIGAVISGGAAIFVFWWGRQSDRIAQRRIWRKELRHFVLLLQNVLDDKKDTYQKNKELADNYQREPLGHHKHKIETNEALKSINDIQAKDIRFALELYPALKDNREDIYNRMYQSLHFYKVHSEVVEGFIKSLKEEWNQLQLAIAEEVATLPVEIMIFIQRPEIKAKYQSFIDVHARLVKRFWEKQQKEKSLKVAYDHFLIPSLNKIDDSYFNISGYEELARRLKHLQNLYVRIRYKAQEIDDVVKEQNQSLKTQNMETEKLLNQLAPVIENTKK